MISNEYRAACDVILAITNQKELLDGTPWLKESIRIRNRYVDPLNMIQVALLRRTFALDGDEESPEAHELRHLSRLTVNGIAAGLRTSG